MSLILKTGCLCVMKHIRIFEMFSYELTTDPWMFYEFCFPRPDWYEVELTGWHGKSFHYPTVGVFYVGWFGALYDTMYIFGRYQAPVRRFVLAMGAHSRLGAGSQLRTLDGNVLGMIARLL
jgi:hypothetical protein